MRILTQYLLLNVYTKILSEENSSAIIVYNFHTNLVMEQTFDATATLKILDILQEQITHTISSTGYTTPSLKSDQLECCRTTMMC